MGRWNRWSRRLVLKDLFVVKFAIESGFGLLKKKLPGFLAKYVLGGPLGYLLSTAGEMFLGFLVSQGIIVIDFGLIGASEAIKLSDYREFAKAAYEKASRKVLSESEKINIRNEYLRALREFGAVK